jgi:hypothetical protein
MLGADVQAIGEPKQAVSLTLIAFVKNIAGGDFHSADDGSRGF